jgi:hypothetical protein
VFESDVFLRPPGGGAARHATVQFSPLLLRFRPDGSRFAPAELSAVLGGTQVCAYNSDLSGTNEGRYVGRRQHPARLHGVACGAPQRPPRRRLVRRSVRGTVSFAVRLKGRSGRMMVRVAVTPPGRGADVATRVVRVNR